MGKQEMALRPIIGRPHQVANAIEAQIKAGVIRSPGEVTIKHLDNDIVAAYLVPRRPRCREDSVAAAMGKALLFGLAVCALVLGVVVVVIAIVGAARIAGFLAVLAVASLAVAWNRSSHSGACSGLHCAGCKG
jgi:hypothetical protein